MSEETANAFFDNHEWAAGLRGDFIRLIVDGGDDVCVYRIVEDEPSYVDRTFCRKIEVVLVPRQHIADYLSIHRECRMISNYLEMVMKTDQKKLAQKASSEI